MAAVDAVRENVRRDDDVEIRALPMSCVLSRKNWPMSGRVAERRNFAHAADFVLLQQAADDQRFGIVDDGRREFLAHGDARRGADVVDDARDFAEDLCRNRGRRRRCAAESADSRRH